MDWQLTCRVCLETGDMVSLFDWDDNNEQLSDKYAYCCGVEVGKEDSLPTLICLNCVDRLTYAYEFKKQCISSNETLRECLDEFLKSSAAVSAGKGSKVVETETITIKQENGLLLQYELPVEHDTNWTRTFSKASNSDTSIITKAPGVRKRGRPRKYPNEHGQIEVSKYTKRKPVTPKKEPIPLTTLLESGALELKQEPEDEENTEEGQEDVGGDFDDDPDFNPDQVERLEYDDEIVDEQSAPRKRGRPKKGEKKPKKPKKQEDDGEDVLLQETIMAFSEPIPDHVLNPKPKKKYPKGERKKYVYEKIHICETCGASFTSNAVLQAHIRRHLGIKPFVCRLHLGLRPYQCSLCGKSFTYSYVLSNHMLTHTGEKKYSCGPCNKKFTKSHHLKYHNKVHHKELYVQQQLEAEAKKARQQMNASGVLAGQIVDGTIQLVHTDELPELQQQNERPTEETPDKETHNAVTHMQAVVMEGDFCIEEEQDVKNII